MAKLIVYDPRANGTPSESFLCCINSFSCAAPITQNCWLVDTDKTCVQIRDLLCPETCPGDRLFVVVVGREAAWIGPLLSSNEAVKRILNNC